MARTAAEISADEVAAFSTLQSRRNQASTPISRPSFIDTGLAIGGSILDADTEVRKRNKGTPDEGKGLIG